MTELATTYSSGASARARASVAGLCLAELVREIPGARLREDAHGDVVVRGVQRVQRASAISFAAAGVFHS